MSTKEARANDTVPRSVPWEERTIDDLGEVFGGSTPSRDIPAYWNGDIPWVTPSDLTPLRDKYLARTEDQITEAGLNNSGARLLPAGALLVTTRATLGAVAIASAPVATNQGLKSIVFTSGANASFYYHVFKRGVPELTRRASGTTFLEISGGEFRKVRLPAPPLPDQEQIAGILDTVDEAVRGTERLIVKLRLTKLAMLQELFISEGAESGGARGDHLATSASRPTWPRVRLEDAADPAAPICYGIVQAGPFVPSGPQVLTIGDLSGDFRTDVHRTAPDIDARYARSRVLPGDVLISIKGTIGRVAVVPQWYAGNISRDLGRLRLGKSMLPEFAKQYLLSPPGQLQMQRSIVGTTRPELSIFVLKRLTIPRPTIEEQMKVAERLTAIDDVIERETNLLEKLRATKTGLMDDLVSGRVSVRRVVEAGSVV